MKITTFFLIDLCPGLWTKDFLAQKLFIEFQKALTLCGIRVCTQSLRLTVNLSGQEKHSQSVWDQFLFKTRRPIVLLEMFFLLLLLLASESL